MSEKKNVPVIRFPEYSEPWTNYKIGDLYTERNERGNDNLQILSVSIHSGVSDGELDEENLGKFVRRSEDKSKYKHVYEGDLVFNMMRAWQGAIGVAKVEGMISPAYISAIPNENVYPLFMDYAMRTRRAIEEINNHSYGVTDFRKRLYWDSFVQLTCNLPSVPEQKRIYNFFKDFDSILALHRRKLEHAKELKKSLLQKMFPKSGERYPEVRFPGFTYPWEQRKLYEVAEKICVGFVGTCEKYYTDESGIPMYRTGNLNGLKLTQDDLKYVTKEFHEQNKKSQLRKGDILIARHGDSGKAVNYELSEEANCLNIVIIRPDLDKCNYQFLADSINSPTVSQHIKSLSAGSTQAVINTSEIEKLDVIIPANIDEQNKVAEFLNDLDNLITLHQRELDHLELLKKALLQKTIV